MLKDGKGGAVQAVADQAEVQAPALRAAVGALDPCRDDARAAGWDDALGRQPVQADADRPLRRPGIADQRGHRRERARAARPGVVGQADDHELARAGRLPASAGRDWARSSAQEIASTLMGRRSADVLPRSGPPGLLSQFLSHSPEFAGGRGSPPVTVVPRHERSRTVTDAEAHTWKACWANPSGVRISDPPPR